MLSNLEAKIHSVTVRVLTRELKPELDEDIPTVLLRLNNIEYHKEVTAKSPVLKSTDSTKPVVSDLQAILDGKLMSIGEISLHWMKAAFLYPDEFTRGKKHQLNATL